jgi:hypothetical protein
VEEALLVNIKQRLAQLLGYEPNLVIFQFLPSLLAVSHEFVQIFLYVFEYKIGLVDNSNHFFELNDAGVIHLP